MAEKEKEKFEFTKDQYDTMNQNIKAVNDNCIALKKAFEDTVKECITENTFNADEYVTSVMFKKLVEGINKIGQKFGIRIEI
jgi:hypothetical protein